MVLYPNKLPESERVCSGICTMNVVLQYVKQKVDERYHPDGYNVGINVNEAAGNRSFMYTCT